MFLHRLYCISFSYNCVDLDNPTKDHFTEDFNLFKGCEFEGDYVWISLGLIGAGKSCFCNFILQEDNIFPEADYAMIPKTQEAFAKCKDFEGKRLCVVDTPGFANTNRGENLKSKSMEVADIFMELTRIMYLAKGGISAFFIVVPLNQAVPPGLHDFLDAFDIFDNYWSHSILVLTYGKQIGGTEKEQHESFKNLLQDPKCPPKLKVLYQKVNNRSVIVEAKHWRTNATYRNTVVKRLCFLSDNITKQYGRYQHNKQSIGWAKFEKAKSKLFEEMRSIAYDILRIKQVNGSDADKQEKIKNVKKNCLGI